MKKTAIVLGGSSGIGKAIAARFAQEGWQVVVAAIDLEGTQEVAAGLSGDGHLALEVDVANDAQIETLKQAVQERYGNFHCLINSVGMAISGPVVSGDFADWNTTVQVMLYGPVKVCRALVPLMEDGGRIVHITSIHYERVAWGTSAYGMSKAAVTQLTRSLAIELAPRNILANAIAPGFVSTPSSIKADGKNELESVWFKDNYLKYDHLPLKRPAQAEEIAGVAWFLAGPDASYMTGSVITVDGGLTITF